MQQQRLQQPSTAATCLASGIGRYDPLQLHANGFGLISCCWPLSQLLLREGQQLEREIVGVIFLKPNFSALSLLLLLLFLHCCCCWVP